MITFIKPRAIYLYNTTQNEKHINNNRNIIIGRVLITRVSGMIEEESYPKDERHYHQFYHKHPLQNCLMLVVHHLFV